MRYILNDKQNEVFASTMVNYLTIFAGGIRCGKSWAVILIIWYYCKKYPGTRIIMMRATYPNLMNLQKTLMQMMAEGLGNDIETYTQLEFKFFNGSSIRLMAESYEDDKAGQRFLGLEFNILVLDELTEFHSEIFNIILSRVGSYMHSDCPAKVICTCNPSRNWVYELRKQIIEGDRKNWYIIQGNLFDNPEVASNETYIKNLKDSLDYNAYKRMVEGDWESYDIIEDRIYNSFDYPKSLTPIKPLYRDDLPLLLSFDFNCNPYSYCLVCQAVGLELFVIEEITSYKNIHDVCDHIGGNYMDHSAGVIVFGDASGKSYTALTERPFNYYDVIMQKLEFLSCNLNVPAKNPNVIPRINFINQIFAGKNDIKIHVSDDIKYLILDLMYIKRDADGTKLKEKEKSNGIAFEKYGHASDCLDYIVTRLYYEKYKESINKGNPYMIREKSDTFASDVFVHSRVMTGNSRKSKYNF